MAWYGNPTIGAISLSGDRQLRKKFERLPKALQKKIAGSAMQKAAKPIVAAARANILPVKSSRKRRREHAASGRPQSFTGNLRKSIGSVLRRYRRSGIIVLVLGPRWPMGAHGHLVEYGTVGERPSPKTGTTGRMPAKPFLRPAWDATIGAAKSILIGVVRAGILAEAKRP